MAIEDHYKTPFTFQIKTDTKVDGRLVRSYPEEGNTYKCAIFTKQSAEVVVYGSAEFVIAKVLYCSTVTPLDLGDILTISGVKYDVVRIIDTNNLGHHLQVGLSTRSG
jgi:hypothetical protein